MATGSTIRFREPTPKDRSPKQTHISQVVPDELFGGFVDFLRNHTVITLAIGFVVATQVQTVVKQLVTSFITPTFQLFFSGSLVNDTLTWHFRGRVLHYQWGLFVSDLLDFLFVLAAIYLIVRFFRLDKLEKPKTK